MTDLSFPEIRICSKLKVAKLFFMAQCGEITLLFQIIQFISQGVDLNAKFLVIEIWLMLEIYHLWSAVLLRTTSDRLRWPDWLSKRWIRSHDRWSERTRSGQKRRNKINMSGSLPSGKGYQFEWPSVSNLVFSQGVVDAETQAWSPIGFSAKHSQTFDLSE